MKCSQCGICCLSAPCFSIPIGSEKWIFKESRKTHSCDYIKWENGKAFCLNKEIQHTGQCTNSKLEKLLERVDVADANDNIDYNGGI
jgi:hypothetical protein